LQVGDLVKLVNDRKVLETNRDIPSDSIGIVTSTPHKDLVDFELAAAWVQWGSRPDWDIMFVEDLEVIQCK
jgi:hypothetical protein